MPKTPLQTSPQRPTKPHEPPAGVRQPRRRPRVMTLIAIGLPLIGLAAGFVGLGNWQLRRAAERDALTQHFADAGSAAPLATLPPGTYEPGLRYRRLRLEGRYLPRTQVLLDNMTHDGQVGYEVLTAFQPDGDGRAVVVNRGWVPGSPDRRELPDVVVDPAERTVLGRIDRLPEPALRLGDPESTSGPLQVMSFPQAPDLARAFGVELAPFQLLLDPSAPGGYVRDWTPAVGLGSRRNRVYAGQWYLMAAVVVGGALVLLLRPSGAAR